MRRDCNLGGRKCDTRRARRRGAAVERKRFVAVGRRAGRGAARVRRTVGKARVERRVRWAKRSGWMYGVRAATQGERDGAERVRRSIREDIVAGSGVKAIVDVSAKTRVRSGTTVRRVAMAVKRVKRRWRMRWRLKREMERP